jgi:PKD repeat protein
MTPEEAKDFKVQYISSSVGLSLKLKNLSEDIPSDIVFADFIWDLGDGSLITGQPKDYKHTYTASGTYKVVLSIQGDVSGTVKTFSCEKWIIVTDTSITHLPESIYSLIDIYIPKSIFGSMSADEKQLYIQKWQLYLQPLVNHEIPIDQFDNEDFYEALENQLIMQLAVYEWMVNYVQTALTSQASSLTTTSEASSGGTTTTSGGIKKIVTGPTEVEYFDSGTSTTEAASKALASIKPGGVLDLVKANLCMLAERLEIYLPICMTRRGEPIPPRVVNRRHPGPLSGPDPIWPVS